MELNELYHKYNIRTDGFERRYVISINDRRYDMDFVTPIELNILVDKEPRNLSDYLVIEGSNPINKNFKNRSWVQLFKQLLDFLQEYNPKANEELLAFRPEWSGSVPFREEKFVNSIEVPGGLYMNVNFTATHSLWFLWDLLNFYDIHCAQISVHRPPVAEPDEIKEAVEKTRKEEFKKFLISKCDRDEEGAQRVLKGIDSLNKLLCAQKSSYNNFYLFDDATALSNYKAKTIQSFSKLTIWTDSQKNTAKKYLDYLTNYFTTFFKESKKHKENLELYFMVL